LLTLLLALFSTGVAAALILAHHHWMQVSASDPRKLLLQEITSALRNRLGWSVSQAGDAR
jgi:hypothetical protein